MYQIIKWLLIINTLLLLSGCWDQKEIEERSTILGLAIDKAEDTENTAPITHPATEDLPTSKIGKVKVTAQLAIPGQIPLGPSQGDSGGSSRDKVHVVEAIGLTLDDAIQSLQQQLAYPIFFGQLQVIIISEEVAKQGINPINEYLRRRPEIRRTAWMAVNGESAAKAMEAAPKLERIPAIYLSAVFEEGVKMGKLPENDLGRFWVSDSNKGQDGYLPLISVEGEENINISGLAYFSNDKMVGSTKPYQISFFNGLTGQNPGGATGFVKLSDEESVMFMSTRRKVNYDSSLKDGRPEFKVTVDVWGFIREKNKESIKLDDMKTIEKIESQTEKFIEQESHRLIKETQERKSDIFGFGEYVRGDLSTFWDDEVETTDKWKEVYKDMKIEIKANVHIDRVGMKAK